MLALLLLFSSTQYLGTGVLLIEDALHGNAMDPLAFVWKTVFTGITFGSGGNGGLFFPALAIGASAGNLFSQVFTLDAALFAAIGAIAVLAAATNTPLTSAVLAMELFGAGVGVHAAFAAVIAFIVSGDRSVFPNQVVLFKKMTGEKRKLSIEEI